MALDAKQLLKMSQQELDAMFSAHDAGPIPDGEAKGTAIIAPGTSSSEAIAEYINIFAWQGKVFDAKAGLLRNHILAIGLKAIIAPDRSLFEMLRQIDPTPEVPLTAVHEVGFVSPSVAGTPVASDG